MKKNNIFDYIFERIIKYDLKSLPIGLYEGKMGVILYLCYYSKIKNDCDARNKAKELLEKILVSPVLKLSDTLHHGFLGIAWGITWLMTEDFLESNKTIEFISAKVNLFCTSKIREEIGNINWEDGILSTPIYYTKIKRNDDTLARYEIDENIIYIVDECENLIEGRYVYIEIDGRLFNSVLYFLKKINKSQIYPTKTEELLLRMTQFYKKVENESFLDHIIHRVLTNQSLSISLPDFSESEVIDLISNAGYYSLLYDNHNIFNQTMDMIIKKWGSSSLKNIFINHISNYPLGLNGLSGIGYGLLNYKNSELCL